MDIRLGFVQPSSLELGYFDLLMDGADLASGNELESAILMSLFTNRLAEPDDRLPEAFTDRQGFWGDAFANREGDLTGSRWWLLAAEKQTNETRLRYLEYAAEALQWLIDDRVASEVHIQAEYLGIHVLGIAIEVVHGDGVRNRYEYLWDQLRQQVETAGGITFEVGETYLLTEDGRYLLTESGNRLIT